jgi:hypothetical protein
VHSIGAISRKIIPLALLLVLLFVAVSARGQNVTASFDTSSTGTNPAAAATREFGIASPIVSMTKTTEDLNNGSSYTRTTNITRGEFLLAGGNQFLVPEIYVSQSQATIALDGDSNPSTSNNNVGLFNAMGSLGFQLGDSIRLGVSISNLNLSYNEKQASGDPVSPSSTSGSLTSQVTGAGVGSTFLLGPIAFGGFYTKYFDNESSNMTQVLLGGAPTNSVGSGYYNQEKFGVGLAIELGNSKAESGARIEASYTEMNFIGTNPMYTSTIDQNMLTCFDGLIARS